MPLLTIPLSPAGAIVDMGVGAARAFTGRANRPGTWRALIDTGADMTVITPSVVSALRPQRLGVVPVGQPGGLRFLGDTYEVRFRFGGHRGPGHWFSVEALETAPATPNIDVLVGVDLLIKIDMVWNGPARLLSLLH